MDRAQFYEGNNKLRGFRFTDHFLAWGWYLTVVEHRAAFTGNDVDDCYRSIDVPPPPLVSDQGLALEQINKLIKVGPSDLPSKTSYKLARETRQALDEKYRHCLPPGSSGASKNV
jgi:hypothetical protein